MHLMKYISSTGSIESCGSRIHRKYITGSQGQARSSVTEIQSHANHQIRIINFRSASMITPILSLKST